MLRARNRISQSTLTTTTAVHPMSISLRIKNSLKNNYILAKLLYRYKLDKSSIGPRPIVIYQMGKVGSTSIRDAVEFLGSFSSVFHVHTLSDRGIQAMEKRYWGNTPVVLRRSLLPETTHVFISHSLKSQFSKNTDVRWKIITLVRDPIARNVSEFFYSVDTEKSDPHIPNFYERYRSGDIKTPELIDRFLERFSEESEEYAVPLDWFDEEFRGVTGVDVYSTKFPESAGFQIVRAASSDILILKLERLADCYRQAFHEFLDSQNMRLVSANTASQKQYHAAYTSFMKEVNLPFQYVSRIYTSKYVRHFYSDQEIEKFMKKWHKA
jgi:hypothetical protein